MVVRQERVELEALGMPVPRVPSMGAGEWVHCSHVLVGGGGAIHRYPFRLGRQRMDVRIWFCHSIPLIDIKPRLILFCQRRR